MLRRLCAECLEGFTDYLEDDPLCPACQVEHDLRGRPLVGKYPEPGDWSYTGLTANDVDIEGGDLSEGFYIASIGHGDYAYERDAAGV